MPAPVRVPSGIGQRRVVADIPEPGIVEIFTHQRLLRIEQSQGVSSEVVSIEANRAAMAAALQRLK